MSQVSETIRNLSLSGIKCTIVEFPMMQYPSCEPCKVTLVIAPNLNG